VAKRIFISFAIEDVRYRDLLVGQARNKKCPFELVDMSVKEPWSEQWKTQCRSKIKGCDGMISLVSKNTAKASGQLWEINCARDEKVPLLGVYTNADDKPASLPTELVGVRVVYWTWDNIARFIDSL